MRSPRPPPAGPIPSPAPDGNGVAVKRLVAWQAASVRRSHLGMGFYNVRGQSKPVNAFLARSRRGQVRTASSPSARDDDQGPAQAVLRL